MKLPGRRQPLKASASDRAIDSHDRRRTVITAEGLRLPFLLASRAARAGALALDLVLIVLLMAGTTVLLVWLAHAVSVDLTRIGQKGSNGPGLTFEVLAVFWFLTMFLFRHAYFLFFELGPRGATPGKRMAGIRVAARVSGGSGSANGGGRLTTEAVIARNLIRDIELFLPFVFLIRAWSDGSDTDLAGWAGLAWFAMFVLFPFFNKDRLRCGDVIAGTWVLEAPRTKLKEALSTSAASKGSSIETGATYRFNAAELTVYGEYELKVLEGVLHDRQDEAMRQVAASIARKIGWDAGAGDEAAFLEAYYTQLRARLEGDMRFGKRKKDKFAGGAADKA